MKQNNIVETLQDSFLEGQSNLHTATPAQITQVNETTINCVPVIPRIIGGKSIKLPEFTNVPVIVLQGGSSYRAYPIAVGDYCVLQFMERCIDGWWNGQNFVPPPDPRMHDYSDAFALVGVKTMREGITIPSVTTDQGDIEHNGNLTRNGNTSLVGNYNQTGGNFSLIGDMMVTGNIVINGNVSVIGTFSVNGVPGISGTFATGDSRTATFVGGILTALA